MNVKCINKNSGSSSKGFAHITIGRIYRAEKINSRYFIMNDGKFKFDYPMANFEEVSAGVSVTLSRQELIKDIKEKIHPSIFPDGIRLIYYKEWENWANIFTNAANIDSWPDKEVFDIWSEVLGEAYLAENPEITDVLALTQESKHKTWLISRGVEGAEKSN